LDVNAGKLARYSSEIYRPGGVVGWMEIERKDYWKTRVKPRLEMVEGWARNGLDNQQIAANLGVSDKTFKQLLVDKEELQDRVQAGREWAEVRVENALFKRAIGFKYKEVTRERKKVFDEDGDWTGEWEMVTTKMVLKEQIPDVTAQTYWLEHRAPRRWERNPIPGLDAEAINNQIMGLAQLLAKPVPERAIGSEEE
jgi:hypothetical protein